MADEQPELTREQVVSLIARHSKQLAELARSHGFETLHYFLHMAAQQADKELRAFRPDHEAT
jgi:hypothetical protein